MTFEAHKLSDMEVRDKRQITVYVAGQVMRVVTHVVYTDTYGALLDIDHRVVLHSGDERLGEYIVKISTDETSITHVFDLQLLLDLRDNWQEYTKERTRVMLRDLFGKVDKND